MPELAATLHQLTLLDLVVMALAAYRLTRIIVIDTLIGKYPDDEHPRGTGFRRALDEFAYTDDSGDTERAWWRGKIAELLTCVWCAGVWVSGGVLAAFVWGPAWLVFVVWLLAVAGGQAFVQSRLNA